MSLTIKIPAIAAKSYQIHLEPDLLAQLPQKLTAFSGFSRIVIITDQTVKKYYAQTLLKILKTQNTPTFLYDFPAGEKYKTIKTKQKLENQMLKAGLGRDTLCLAVGGGVVGDMTGFIAATYMRGIPYIQVPTTLLAMVDSSVGGKTGINTPYGKNLLGAFWQPLAVFADLNCLNTLPLPQRVNGLIEAAKIFLTHDAKYFGYLETHLSKILSGDVKLLGKIIKRAVYWKAKVVKQDPHEKNLRSVLNFGHTIGHALEQVSNYKLLHGYAVGYGILIEAKMSQHLGILPAQDYQRIIDFFAKLEITARDLKKIPVKKILQTTKIDKKATAEGVKYVLLKQIGQYYHEQDQVAQLVADSVVASAFRSIEREINVRQ
ncbi:MAG: 3-dehydroquinate synthase [Gammaproteobacteria bacterium]